MKSDVKEIGNCASGTKGKERGEAKSRNDLNDDPAERSSLSVTFAPRHTSIPPEEGQGIIFKLYQKYITNYISLSVNIAKIAKQYRTFLFNSTSCTAL